MLRGYFDESGHSTDPVLTAMAVGGCVAKVLAWERLERQWQRVLDSFGVSQLHMKTFAHSVGEFKGWSEERRQDFLGELLKLMNRHVSIYAGEAISLTAYRSWDESRREILKDPYYGCLAFTLQAVTGYAARHGEMIEIVFAEQPQYSTFAYKIYTEARSALRHGNRLASFTLASPKTLPALQAADLVAYELRNGVTQKLSGQSGKKRWPMRQIMSKGTQYLRFIRERKASDNR